MPFTPLALVVFVRLIWVGAIAFVLLGAIILAVLVLRRARSEAKAAREAFARKAARRSLLRRANGLDEPGAWPAALSLEDWSELFDEVHQMLRGEARDRLAALGEKLGLDRYLVERLGRGTPARRAEAARCLALFEGDAATAALERALEHPHEAVRLAAAEALLDRVPNPAALAARVLRRRVSGAGRRFLINLARKNGAAAIVLLKGADDLSRVGLIDALAEAGEGRAVGPIAALAATAEAGAVRAAALRALGRLRAKKTSELALNALDDPDPGVRAEAQRLTRTTSTIPSGPLQGVPA